ncbi:hypothetical protein SBADM41S_10550 [Streptomyces badius]
MADGQQGRPGLGAVSLDDGDQGGRGGRVEHRGHLVADQQPGPQHQGPGEAGTLELAVAHRVRPALQQLGGEADQRGQFRHPLGDVPATAGGPQRLGDQFAQAEAGVGGEPGLLEDDTDGGALLARGAVPPAAYQRAVEGHGSGVRAVQEGGDLGQGGLSAAAGAQQSDRLARRDAQGHTADDGVAAVVAGGDPVQLKHRRTPSTGRPPGRSAHGGRPGPP